MKITLASHRFFPQIGGIETMSELLARRFVEQGHQVTLVTQTPHENDDEFPFRVVRQPNRRQLINAVRWGDVFFHNNIGLQTAWPLLLVRRPWVIAHQTWISRMDSSMATQDKLKKAALRFATNISISQAVAEHIRVPSTIIGNAYNDENFFEMPAVVRDRDLVFLGRLVSDKGLDVLLEALDELQTADLRPNLTVIGDGPELEALQKQAADLKLNVEFVGARSGAELRALLNRHRILVVPSRWKEPFGIVALEGIACGCVAVGSQDGGLKDAIGPCGVTFANGNAHALAHALNPLLRDEEKLKIYREAAPAHLENHRSDIIAKKYLKVFHKATGELIK